MATAIKMTLDIDFSGLTLPLTMAEAYDAAVLGLEIAQEVKSSGDALSSRDDELRADVPTPLILAVIPTTLVNTLAIHFSLNRHSSPQPIVNKAVSTELISTPSNVANVLSTVTLQKAPVEFAQPMSPTQFTSPALLHQQVNQSSLIRHSREGGNPEVRVTSQERSNRLKQTATSAVRGNASAWIPAFAGMTREEKMAMKETTKTEKVAMKETVGPIVHKAVQTGLISPASNVANVLSTAALQNAPVEFAQPMSPTQSTSPTLTKQQVNQPSLIRHSREGGNPEVRVTPQERSSRLEQTAASPMRGNATPWIPAFTGMTREEKMAVKETTKAEKVAMKETVGPIVHKAVQTGLISTPSNVANVLSTVTLQKAPVEFAQPMSPTQPTSPALPHQQVNQSSLIRHSREGGNPEVRVTLQERSSRLEQTAASPMRGNASAWIPAFAGMTREEKMAMREEKVAMKETVGPIVRKAVQTGLISTPSNVANVLSTVTLQKAPVEFAQPISQVTASPVQAGVVHTLPVMSAAKNEVKTLPVQALPQSIVHNAVQAELISTPSNVANVLSTAVLQKTPVEFAQPMSPTQSTSPALLHQQVNQSSLIRHSREGGNPEIPVTPQERSSRLEQTAASPMRGNASAWIPAFAGMTREEKMAMREEKVAMKETVGPIVRKAVQTGLISTPSNVANVLSTVTLQKAPVEFAQPISQVTASPVQAGVVHTLPVMSAAKNDVKTLPVQALPQPIVHKAVQAELISTPSNVANVLSTAALQKATVEFAQPINQVTASPVQDGVVHTPPVMSAAKNDVKTLPVQALPQPIVHKVVQTELISTPSNAANVLSAVTLQKAPVEFAQPMSPTQPTSPALPHQQVNQSSLIRHSRESGNPEVRVTPQKRSSRLEQTAASAARGNASAWIPAFAGMTREEKMAVKETTKAEKVAMKETVGPIVHKAVQTGLISTPSNVANVLSTVTLQKAPVEFAQPTSQVTASPVQAGVVHTPPVMSAAKNEVKTLPVQTLPQSIVHKAVQTGLISTPSNVANVLSTAALQKAPVEFAQPMSPTQSTSPALPQQQVNQSSLIRHSREGGNPEVPVTPQERSSRLEQTAASPMRGNATPWIPTFTGLKREIQTGNANVLTSQVTTSPLRTSVVHTPPVMNVTKNEIKNSPVQVMAQPVVHDITVTESTPVSATPTTTQSMAATQTVLSKHISETSFLRGNDELNRFPAKSVVAHIAPVVSPDVMNTSPVMNVTKSDNQPIESSFPPPAKPLEGRNDEVNKIDLPTRPTFSADTGTKVSDARQINSLLAHSTLIESDTESKSASVTLQTMPAPAVQPKVIVDQAQALRGDTSREQAMLAMGTRNEPTLAGKEGEGITYRFTSWGAGHQVKVATNGTTLANLHPSDIQVREGLEQHAQEHGMPAGWRIEAVDDEQKQRQQPFHDEESDQED